MEIKCCVCDLDGTLLNSRDKINPQDRQALKALSDKGCKIVIATGRVNLQIFEYVDVLNIAGPVITCNGGYIIDTATGEELRGKNFPPELLRELVAHCQKRNYDFLLYTRDYVYYPTGGKRINKFINYNKTAAPEHRVPIRCFDDEWTEDLYSSTLKLMMPGPEEQKDEFVRLFGDKGEFTAVVSGQGLFDIMPGTGTSKGEGVEFLAKKLGIPLAQVAVFGDSPNDESMFRIAGIPVAMGNACPEIKELASFVTLTNDEGGISHALKELGAI